MPCKKKAVCVLAIMHKCKLGQSDRGKVCLSPFLTDSSRKVKVGFKLSMHLIFQTLRSTVSQLVLLADQI